MLGKNIAQLDSYIAHLIKMLSLKSGGSREKYFLLTYKYILMYNKYLARIFTCGSV